MSYQPDYDLELLEWNYLNGNIHTEQGSVGQQRFAWLLDCANKEPTFLLSLHDVVGGGWTTHKKFFRSTYGKLSDSGTFSTYDLFMAYDVHRSLLSNEVVIESDERCTECQRKKREKEEGVIGCIDCYSLNVVSAVMIGKLLENKGWVPHYYYSGSKSIHIHCYFDWSVLCAADLSVQCSILGLFAHKETFVREFMLYLRVMMNTGWGLMKGSFDMDLTKPKHLIRSELSRNKAGYKTFLGYSWKNIPSLPPIVTERNGKQPLLGVVRLSTPENPTMLLEEFLSQKKKVLSVEKQKRKYGSLLSWVDPVQPGTLKGCVEYILSDDFKELGDGFHRAAFILSNELLKLNKDESLSLLREWNLRMGGVVLDQELIAMVSGRSSYVLSHEYVHSFLADLGLLSVGVVCRARRRSLVSVPQVLNSGAT